MTRTKDERQTLDPETPSTSRDVEEDRTPDALSSTGAAYALASSDVKHAIDSALAYVADGARPIEARAPAYVALRRLKLQIDRAIREPGRELQAHMSAMVEHRPERVTWGPLRLAWKAVGVKWPVNDRGNWQDDGVQDWLRGWRSSLDSMYPDAQLIVDVPAHLELDTKALGVAIAKEPSATLRRFYAELKGMRLRTEEARSASIEVDE